MTADVLQMFPGSHLHPVFLRSSAKPFQSVGLYEHDSAGSLLLPQEWAIVCASHSASEEHLGWVRGILKKGCLEETDLQCGPHMPIDEAMANQLICSHQKPTAIHNNCSGKHAGMLLACKLYGYPTETYLDPAHPLQQKILAHIQKFSGAEHITLATDGCGAPVFALPLPHAAALYANLAANPYFDKLYQALTQYPVLVGGHHRIDTMLMTLSKGNLVAKVGAEGFLGVGNRAKAQGLAIKIIDGNSTVRDQFIVALLEELGWLDAEAVAQLQAIPAFSPNRVNTQGKTVGQLEFSFPWA